MSVKVNLLATSRDVVRGYDLVTKGYLNGKVGSRLCIQKDEELAG